MYVECDVSATDADRICWEFIHEDPMIKSMNEKIYFCPIFN